MIQVFVGVAFLFMSTSRNYLNPTPLTPRQVSVPHVRYASNLQWLGEKQMLGASCTCSASVVFYNESQTKQFRPPHEGLEVRSIRYVSNEDCLHVTYKGYYSRVSFSVNALYDWMTEAMTFCRTYRNEMFVRQFYDKGMFYNVNHDGNFLIHSKHESGSDRRLFLPHPRASFSKIVYIQDCAFVLIHPTGFIDLVSVRDEDQIEYWNRTSSTHVPEEEDAPPSLILDALLWSQNEVSIKIFLSFDDGRCQCVHLHLFPEQKMFRMISSIPVDLPSTGLMAKRLYRCSTLYGADSIFALFSEKRNMNYMMNVLGVFNVAAHPPSVTLFPNVEVSPTTESLVFPAANVIVTDGSSHKKINVLHFKKGLKFY